MAAGDVTQGRRLPDVAAGDPENWQTWKDARPGDYIKVTGERDGRDAWYLKDPRGSVGALRTHTVEEHDDGTITVSPSIDDPPNGWHGFLECGVWREV